MKLVYLRARIERNEALYESSVFLGNSVVTVCSSELLIRTEDQVERVAFKDPGDGLTFNCHFCSSVVY